MRRTRHLLAVAGILAVAAFGLVGPASAAPEGKYADHVAEECAHALAAGKTVDEGCHKAPNTLLPETSEIFWGAFGFFIVMFGMWKYAVPSVKNTLDARAEKISGDINAAEAQRTEASTILAEYQAQLTDARHESARIIEEARQTADGMKRELQSKAEADITELRTRATAEIETAKIQAIADLRGEVADLAIGAAEQVVGHSLDRDTNVALVEAYINSVGATR